MHATHSLNTFLASLVLRDIEKGKSPDEYVLFSDYMVRAGFLFEMGAVLGHTLRDRLDSLVSLIAAPGTEQQVISFLQGQAAERVMKLNGKPADFALVYFAPEATRIIGAMRGAGLTDATDWLEMHKVASQKLRVADIFTSLQIAPAEGIGFGSRYPDLTSELLTSDSGAVEAGGLRTAGLNVPAMPKKKTILERREMAVSMIRPFVQQVRPDLAVVLGL